MNKITKFLWQDNLNLIKDKKILENNHNIDA